MGDFLRKEELMRNYRKPKVRRRGDASFVAISATTVALVAGSLRTRPMREKRN
jgi:hypothetical protein